MKKSIREDLMEALGVTKEEASKLISTYSRNHEGKVNIAEIKKDMERITDSMIYELGTVYKDYDIKFEILDCGKDRQESAILELLDDEEREIALSYLTNRYSENVNTWALTFYHIAQKKLLKILDGNMKEYREFVDKLPYKNINRVVRTYGVESEFAVFLAKKGREEDFEQFMTDIEPIRDEEAELMEKYVSNYSGKIEERKCPKNLRDKIFRKIQDEVKINGTITFERENIMKGLSSIHNNRNLTQKQKENLEDLFIKCCIENRVDYYFADFAKARNAVTYNGLMEYLEKYSDAEWYQKEEFITANLLPEIQKNMQLSYDELLAEFMKKSKKEKITPEEIYKEVHKSKLLKNEKNSIRLLTNEDEEKISLEITVTNPVVIGDRITFEIDGSKLKEIMDLANEGSLNEAKKKIEEFTQTKIGEISIINDYKTKTRFRYSHENVIGTIGDGEDTPFLTKISNNYLDLTDFQVKGPYDTINDQMRIIPETAEMTPEQIEQFNHNSEPVKFKTHTYRFGRVDGYYNREVYDFELNGEKYHIKGADWTNGGSYTVVWKGEEKNYPETAIGICSSYSEWARNQCGIDKEKALDFISKNPMRFLKFYDKWANKSNSCGLFPTTHIESICKDIMEMEPESKLRELSEKVSQIHDMDFVQEVANKAIIRKKLEDKEKGAKELLAEYEKLEANKGVSVGEE